MDSWIYGVLLVLCVWIFGFLDLWIYGLIGSQGFFAVGFMDFWIYGFMDLFDPKGFGSWNFGFLDF